MTKLVKNFNTRNKIKAVPNSTGVYIFKDHASRILYIGKAINLKNRVRSHFDDRTDALKLNFLKQIADLDWIVTENEKQAYILENDLIKKYKPRYNIQWRDDKGYFWVAFLDNDWPRVKIVHKRATTSKEKILIGPFVNGLELRRLLRTLRKFLPYRTCKNPYDKPCLQWHLGLCPAHDPKYNYRESKSPEKIGSGIRCQTKKTDFQNQKNQYLFSLNTLAQFLRLYAGEPIRIEAYDVSNIHGVWATGSMIVFYGDKPQKSDYRRFKIKTVQGANDTAMIKEVLTRRFGHSEWPKPDLILIDGGITQLRAAAKSLASGYSLIPIIALAKQQEKLYTKYNNKVLKLNALPLSLRLIFQAIRNEAHRFAIFYYRYLHEKQYRSGANSTKNRKKIKKETKKRP